MNEKMFNKQSHRCPCSIIKTRDDIQCRASGEECCIDFCPMLYWLPIFIKELAITLGGRK